MKIGLMLPIGDPGLLRGPDRWTPIREMVRAAEASGLDSVWCADHLITRRHGLRRDEGPHESWTTLSAIAAMTERVELGPLVLCVPFRNPGLTAKMATTLDEISGGRLILGLGCGWQQPEFDAFGYEFDHRVSQFDEAIRIIRPLLRGETVTFDGEWQHAHEARVVPPGPRRAGPPILIAGRGPRMLGLVARYADAWNAAWYGRPEGTHELRDRIGKLHEALDAAGRPRASIEITAGVFVMTGPGGGDRPREAIDGSVDDIAHSLAGYAALGISHLVAHVWPRTPDAVHTLGEAAVRARGLLADAGAPAPILVSSR
ncbi:MAG TPA: LLM class flavin-dependent oxidoreductase [Candidatus Limnocylindrales bacterium]|nr:LLM class flavin-dependent oxidoreductase [Candidatus Limnocylindrales bacterium]